MNKRCRVLLAGTAAGLAFHPIVGNACSLCMGGADGKTGEALNGAIFLMLGFIGSMLAAIIVSAMVLARRARLAAPPHAEFNDTSLETPAL